MGGPKRFTTIKNIGTGIRKLLSDGIVREGSTRDFSKIEENFAKAEL